MKKSIALFNATLVAMSATPLLGAALASTLTDPETSKAMLDKQNEHFIQRVVQVAPNVYTGVGFHGANTSMIVGDDGVIIIDTLMGPESAANAMKAFRQFTDKPVKAIIYTHSHGDHTGGASAFMAEAIPNAVIGKDIDLIGHVGMGGGHGSDSSIDTIAAKRDLRQFGRKLPLEDQTNRGLAPAKTIDHDRGTGYIPANIRIDADYKTTIAGVDLELIPAAGETNDAIFIWLPKEKVLFTGDNFYQAFPNLYAIRGTPYRDVRVWAKSVAKMASYKPQAVVPGHTTPIMGEQESVEALQSYSDAIQYVFDATVQGMNQGLDPVTIAQSIELPSHYADKPYLTQFYGTIEGASRAIYSGLMGWFDGNPVNLNPLSHTSNARKMAQLAGGSDKLLESFNEAMEGGEYQWALVLAESLLLLEDVDAKVVREAQIVALRAMAAMEYNAPKRNYYLTYARELEAQ
ncbi:MAG: alkyl/aryl-sulfatase [Pseudomonadota bacterium]